MKKVLSLIVLLSFVSCCPVPAQVKPTLPKREIVKSVVKPDTTSEKGKTLFLLTKIYQDYQKECYKDSAMVNCYILLSSDGKTAKYDTICGVSLMLFDASGVAPLPLKAKASYWVHKPASQDGFMKWLKETGKEK